MLSVASTLVILLSVSKIVEGAFRDGFGVAHGRFNIRGFDARFMLDELNLAVMTTGMIWIAFHCRQWKRERTEFSHWLNIRSDAFAQVAGDAMEALEDIVDGVSSMPAGGGSTHTPSGIGELLTGLIMNQMNMPVNHGSPQDEVREIREEVDNSSASETENESS